MDELSRRRMLTATLALAAGALGGRRAFAAGTATEERPVQAFDKVDWDAVGELVIEQTGTEHVRVEAEPHVLPKILTEVRGGRLLVSIAPGRLQTEHPIRIRVGLRTLRALHTRGAGDVHLRALSTDALELDLSAAGAMLVDELNARRLTLHMRGAGDVTVARGSVDAQEVMIGGSGEYTAPRLASRRTTVRIEGSGNAQVSAREDLLAQILGSGEIGYLGNPSLREEISGAGRVLRLDL